MTLLLKIRLAMKVAAMIPEMVRVVEPHVQASVAMRRAAEVMNQAADLQEEKESLDESEKGK